MSVIDDATPILQNAIDEVFRLGGGRVVVGRGFYSIKGLRLRSRVTLYLERGAILQASRNATMPVRHQPGNIVVRNCKVENAARLVRYNFRSDAWQYARPLADIRFEGMEASGLCLPVALNGGKAEDGDLPLEFTMTDSSLSFAKPQTEVFSVSNVRTFALTNVTVSGVSAPLVRTWGRPPEMKLSGVHGVPAEIVEGKGPFQCPWWK